MLPHVRGYRFSSVIETSQVLFQHFTGPFLGGIRSQAHSTVLKCTLFSRYDLLRSRDYCIK